MFLKTLEVPFIYLFWHYVLAWLDVWGLYTNFVWFIWNYFSIPILLKTLLSPWRRLAERRRDLVGNFIVSFMMRLVGLLIRSVTVAVGLAVLICMLLLAPVVFIVWVILPAVAIGLLIAGILSLAA